MAGGHSPTEAELGLKGWQKTFNSVTLKGRLNLAYASIAFWGSLFAIIKFRPKKTNANAIEGKK